MNPSRLFVLIVSLALAPISTSALRAAADASFTRKEDVIYGRKHGTALTMDVFTPKGRANGAAVVFCVSGGWRSAHRAINPSLIRPLVDRGYTVFAVVHGSQPKFTVPEILEDMHRAVRFIRYHADRYGIDPGRIGITGGSAGGHLSLMQGTAGTIGNADADDPIDRVSSRVQAVACFYPPTDFLNWGRPGRHLVQILREEKEFLRPAPDFHAYDAETKRFERITDEERVLEIAKQISPITHVTADDPPSLILHGDADSLVPIQQAEVIVEAFKKTGVIAKLTVKAGAGHGWRGMEKDLETFADWFDKYLVKPTTQRNP